MTNCYKGVLSSSVERCPDKTEADGPTPSVPTEDSLAKPDLAS